MVLDIRLGTIRDLHKDPHGLVSRRNVPRPGPRRAAPRMSDTELAEARRNFKNGHLNNRIEGIVPDPETTGLFDVLLDERVPGKEWSGLIMGFPVPARRSEPRGVKMADDPYVYPGTNVLRYKLDERDCGELEKARRNGRGARAADMAAGRKNSLPRTCANQGSDK